MERKAERISFVELLDGSSAEREVGRVAFVEFKVDWFVGGEKSRNNTFVEFLGGLFV